MKFSYRLIKKLNPKLPDIKKAAQLLTDHLFEAEPVDKNTLEVEVLPNRYSDAACHWGLAVELSAFINKPWLPNKSAVSKKSKSSKAIHVNVKTTLCRRMAARYIEGVKIKPSPRWLQDVLVDAGFQPINNLVDITNYVTLETGQPLHAFDWDKASGDMLLVRNAERGEMVTSLEGKEYELNGDDLVLADNKGALDVAGIKGGQRAEIDDNTHNILLTAGNFDGASIYKTSRKIGIQTDASSRFSHNITPELVGVGLDRAAELVLELCGGKAGKAVDVYQEKPPKILLKFDTDHFNKLSGLNIDKKTALNYLKQIGFTVKPGKDLVEVPFWRTDITLFEDLAEEVMRLYGYDNLEPQAMRTALKATEHEESVIFGDNVRQILSGLGFDEVYNYSFVSADSEGIELENPISKAYAKLRPSLSSGLLKTTKDNLRFFDNVFLFEIGHVFYPGKKNYPAEHSALGLAMAFKKGHAFFDLKGRVEQLFERLGLTNFSFKEEGGQLRIESDHHVIGYLRHHHEGGVKVALAEVNLGELITLVDEERSYEPFAKYPSIMRDISLLVPQEVRFDEIMSVISAAAPKYLEDVDLIDFYEDKKFSGGRRSITLRLVFLADDKTLTDKEVDKELAGVSKALVDKFDVEIR